LGDSHQFEKGILAPKKDNKDYVRARAKMLMQIFV
jgi:hypothetical protein